MPQILLQVLQFFTGLLEGHLGMPLERGVGFGYKAGNRYVDHLLSFGVFGGQAPGKICNPLDIIHLFKGKACHKVQLDVFPAQGEGVFNGFCNALFGEVLVDDVSQALGSGLGRNGKTGFTDTFDQFHELGCQFFRPDGRQADGIALALAQQQKFFHQCRQLRIISGAQREQGDIRVARVCQRCLGDFKKIFQASFPHRPVNHSRLAESAAPGTSPGDFQAQTVMDRFSKGHNR